MTMDHMPMEERIARLLSPEREEELDPFLIMTFMPLEPYDQVADVGCGPGFFTIPLAKYLTYGQVYALDTQDEMVEVVRRRAAQVNLGNVQALKCSPYEFPVPAGSLDGIFMAFVIHENDDYEAFLKAVRELLKPQGWCTVLEWYRKETDGGPPLDRRMDPEELEELAQRAGFQFRGMRDLNGKHYMVTLRR